MIVKGTFETAKSSISAVGGAGDDGFAVTSFSFGISIRSGGSSVSISIFERSLKGYRWTRRLEMIFDI